MLGVRHLIHRASFAARFRTWRRLAYDRAGRLHACGRESVHVVPARCPHQGSPLINARVEGDEIVCHWHGCRYRLKEGTWAPARVRNA